MCVEQSIDGSIIELHEKPFGRSVFGKVTAVDGNDFIVEMPDKEKRRADGVMQLNTFHEGLWVRGDIMITEPCLRGFVFRFMRDPHWAQLPQIMETCAPSLVATIGSDAGNQTTLAAIGKDVLAVYGEYEKSEDGSDSVRVECGPTMIQLDVVHAGIIDNTSACATLYQSAHSSSLQDILWNNLFKTTEAPV